MTPAERLIVALDGAPDQDLYRALRNQAGVMWFKIGVSTLLSTGGLELARYIVEREDNLFLDLKLYDTRDTVDRTIHRAFDLGVRFVTVHATPSVMESAMRAKPADPRCKVLAVPTLTDQPTPKTDIFSESLDTCDGIVCSADRVRVLKMSSVDKIFICPGIRRGPPKDRPNAIVGGYEQPDNHVTPATPTEALRAGADYLVVGRPIYAAPDPVAEARAILKEMENVR